MKGIALLVAVILAFPLGCATVSAVELGQPSTVAAEAGSGVQNKPAMAYGPSTGSGAAAGVYLAVWQDGDETADSDGPGTGIYCARISPDGKALDPKGIPVCQAKDYQLRPRVAFAHSTSSGQAGNVFLVVWEDYRNGADGDIYAARVTPEGKVLDPDGFPVAAIKDRNQVYVAVASNGKDFLVAWMDYWTYPTYGLAMARVSADGTVTPKDGALVIKEDDAKLKGLAEKLRSSQELTIPWTRGKNWGGSVGTVNFPDLIFVDGHYLCVCNDYVSTGRRLVRIPAEGVLKAESGRESTLPFHVEKGFNHAFVAGPQQGWMYFLQENFGRGQDGKLFTYLVVKPDGSLPAPDGNKNFSMRKQGLDERRIVDLNCAGAFDGRQYWIALEAKAGIALGRLDVQGALSELDLSGDKARSQAMLATGEGCTHPALASDGKGGVMAVWSEDAGINDVRLKCRSLRETQTPK